MKNFISALLVIFLLGTSGTAHVAFGQSSPEADKTSAMVSKKMLQVLRLNELEYIKVKELNFARVSKMTEALTMYSHDQAGLDTRLNEIEKEFEANLAGVLKKDTFLSYASFKMTPEGDVMAMMKKTPAPGAAPVR
ncbi:hypothetical protein TH61_03675 [Rufibacter sp. DG15C]|uniref:hypothetical protein n=1 Tax=Rufibacter sp. DG15C TaxID=1379909 RepID=UPI00078E8F0E|nr:hypothetical protein [Rufibacter sp. DG15C]AMM50464.1 hypothetical protein TH61_03675 [Rufibacter sp. DG15C]